jgi:type I restriction enzyme S subunit
LKAKPLGEIIRVHYGAALREAERDPEGPFTVFGSSGKVGRHSKKLVGFPTIIIGRKGSAGSITWAPDGGWPIDTAFYVEPIDPARLHLRYLYHALTNAQLSRYAITTAIPGLSREDIYRTAVPYPSLQQQQRIAEVLDTADGMRTKQRQAIELSEDFLRSAFVTVFGDPTHNPNNWEIVRLDEITKSIDYGITASADAKPVGPKFLRITDIQGNRVDWDTVPYCRCDERKAAEARLERGDIVFARTGATTGKSFLIAQHPENAVFASYLIRVRPSESVNPFYLAEFFQSAAYWSQVKSMAQGAAQPGINASKLSMLRIPLPPLKVQDRFATIAETVAQLGSHLAVFQKDADSLFASLIQRGLSGELSWL